MAAIPKAVRPGSPMERLRRCSGLSACCRNRSIGFVRQMLAAGAARRPLELMPSGGALGGERWAARCLPPRDRSSRPVGGLGAEEVGEVVGVGVVAAGGKAGVDADHALDALGESGEEV